MNKTRGQGFSLVELLVCVAIISILAAMYMAALSKARRKAEGVVVMEGFRQDFIGRTADNANSVNLPSLTLTDRDLYRQAFRKQMPSSQGPFWASEVLCEIEDERAFRAYWHTVINPAAREALEIRDGRLLARDENGTEFSLKFLNATNRMGPPVPVSWEFLSTDLSETSSGTLGTTVSYSDGHVEYARYPGDYPACKTVAELSHRFLQGGT